MSAKKKNSKRSPAKGHQRKTAQSGQARQSGQVKRTSQSRQSGQARQTSQPRSRAGSAAGYRFSSTKAPTPVESEIFFTPTTRDPLPSVDYTQVMKDISPGYARRAFIGLLLTGAGYIVATLILVRLGAALSWLFRGRQGSMSDAYSAVVGYEVPEGVAIVNLALAATIIVVLLVARWVNAREPGWMVSIRPGMRVGYLVGCFVIGFVILNGVYLLGRLGQPWDISPPPHAWLWVVLVLLTSPLQAAGEEFLFRGYIQQSLGAMTGHRWEALIASALVFAVMHGSQNLPLFVDRLGFGLVAGVVVLVTGGLEASIAVHAANNVSSFCYAIATGTISQTRQVSESSWSTTISNVGAYVLAGILAIVLAKIMKLKNRTPDLLEAS